MFNLFNYIMPGTLARTVSQLLKSDGGKKVLNSVGDTVKDVVSMLPEPKPVDPEYQRQMKIVAWGIGLMIGLPVLLFVTWLTYSMLFVH